MPDTINQDDDLTLTIGEPEDDKEGKKGLKALFSSKLFIVALVLVLAAGGLTVWTLMKKPADEPAVEEDTPAPEERHPIKKQVFFPNILDMGMFEVPLGDKGGQLSLKVGIRVEVTSPAVKQELERRSIQMKSTITSTMGIKTLSELTGVDGKIVLKKELVTALNSMLETGRAINVYFYEFLIQ